MNRIKLLSLQVLVAVVFLAIWHIGTTTSLFGSPRNAQFFFSTPGAVIERTIKEFASCRPGTPADLIVMWSRQVPGCEIFFHIGITLLETILAFITGAVGGVVCGFLLARNDLAAAVFDPYIKAINALPRVVLAPIFALWFGLGIWSKVALGFTLVFFIVFFSVYQGVREVSPTVLSNARMLGMNDRQLLRHVYWPSAMTWMFASLHTSVGFALVGAVVGEYLGSSAGLGYKIHQAESVFDVTGVFSGMLILMVFVLIIDFAVTALEKRLLVWRPGQASTSAQG